MPDRRSELKIEPNRFVSIDLSFEGRVYVHGLLRSFFDVTDEHHYNNVSTTITIYVIFRDWLLPYFPQLCSRSNNIILRHYITTKQRLPRLPSQCNNRFTRHVALLKVVFAYHIKDEAIKHFKFKYYKA